MHGVNTVIAGATAIICLTIVLYQLIALQLIQRDFKRNLLYRTTTTKAKLYSGIKSKPIRALMLHLDILLNSTGLSIRVSQFINITILLTIVGAVLGSIYFTELSSITVCTLLFACLPYLIIKGYLTSQRIEAQREFLPAIELFYQYYLITGGKQIKLTLAKTIEEKGLLPTMHQTITQLHRNLTLYPDIEYSLSVFNHATGHKWSRLFSQLLMVSLNEGVSIKGGLKDLIDDMRKARKTNEQERHRLLEIRIANFTPLVFLLFFLGINFTVNAEQSLEAYFYDEAGRKMLLHSFVLIALSLLMGIHLSRKKMG